MAKKNLIQVSEIQKGDLIKVKYTFGSLKVTREDIAEYRDAAGMWRNVDGHALGTSYGDMTSIELVDRPAPVIELPTGQHAVISYVRINPPAGMVGGQRYATLLQGEWTLSNGSVSPTPSVMSESLMTHHVNNTVVVSDFTVLFAGIAK